MDAHRIQRLGDEMKSNIAKIIPTLKDPRLSGIVSITRVELSNDSKYAKVFVSVMGDEEDLKECLKGFKSSAGYIRRELASSMRLRHTPELSFHGDRGIVRARATLDLLNEIKKSEEGRGNGEEEA